MGTYTTKNGDMWDSIAYEQLGSASYMDQLMQANPGRESIFLFPAGITLTLPQVEDKTDTTTPPWKR